MTLKIHFLLAIFVFELSLFNCDQLVNEDSVSSDVSLKSLSLQVKKLTTS